MRRLDRHQILVSRESKNVRTIGRPWKAVRRRVMERVRNILVAVGDGEEET